MKFPEELREFFTEIGYGFMCIQDDDMIDRVMDPEAIADFRLCQCSFEMNEMWEHYNEDFLVFFEASDTSFIAIKLKEKNAIGESPVYYYDTKIADSLKEFFKKMDNSVDYYLEC